MGKLVLIPRVVSEIQSHSVAGIPGDVGQAALPGPPALPVTVQEVHSSSGPTRLSRSGTLSAATKYQEVCEGGTCLQQMDSRRIALLSAYYILGASHRSSPHV